MVKRTLPKKRRALSKESATFLRTVRKSTCSFLVGVWCCDDDRSLIRSFTYDRTATVSQNDHVLLEIAACPATAESVCIVWAKRRRSTVCSCASVLLTMLAPSPSND